MNYKITLSEKDQDEFDNLSLNLDFAILNLSDLDRLALFLHFWQGKTVLEISRILNTSWPEADRLIDEAMGSLRSLLFLSEDLKEATGY